MDDLDGAHPDCVYDAPMALDPDLSQTDGLDPAFARARHKRLLYDFKKCIIGPLPVDAFMKRAVGKMFSGTDERMRLSATNAFRSVPRTADTVEQILEPLLLALNRRTKHKSRCPGFVFENTARRSTHPTRPGFAKPHISCLTRRNVEAVRRLDHHSRSELGYAELFIQVTADATRDFFTDPPPGLDAEHRAAFDFVTERPEREIKREVENAFALHIAFVTEVFARQHRNAYYSISMAGSRARLIRWDRAGCVVSEAFDIREHPEHLCNFLWRFSRTSDTLRGHDNTVRPATVEEELQFRDVVKEYVRSQLEVEGEALDRALSQHYCPGRAAVVEIYPHRQPPSRDNAWHFIISRPVVTPLLLVGRGTRGNWAVECTTSCLVFLKDTWHVLSEGTGTVEGDILGHLNTLGIRNVPTLFTHGDIPDYISNEGDNVLVWQATRTGNIAKKYEGCRIAGRVASIRDMQRYRLAVSTVGYGLSTIRGTEELLHATYDAFTAMRDALSKASLIHRDISLGNIILVKVPGQTVRRGYLIDWETSDPADDAGTAVHAGRAGTWYFMSARMLDIGQADSQQTFFDDMESLVHVITYCALLYLSHGLTKKDLLSTIQEYFEYAIKFSPEPAHGGAAKGLNAFSRVLIKEAEFGSNSLAEWLATMLQFQRPGLEVDRFEYGKLWTPEHVDKFWSEFLETRVLERDDRIVHDITKDGFREYSRLSTTPPVVPTPPLPTPPLKGKRYAANRDGDMPNPKRRRSLRVQEASGLHSAVIVSSRIVDGRRRSERIRSVQDRPQPREAGASSTRRSSSQPSSTAVQRRCPGTTGRGRGRARR
ncbi:hypothetical protein BC628DRAFT_1407361 [Trametes gibbosa]|nr:hypothetical protein BC628DRAFT_1407361 [Trametes gibbosa]